jgi:peptidoglycan hydrolase-like protein with peptidoglycan-binding domain
VLQLRAEYTVDRDPRSGIRRSARCSRRTTSPTAPRPIVEWEMTPQGIDGIFGPKTRTSVEAFQTWGGVAVDGVVGDQTWTVSLHAASATLESAVGLNFVID